MSCQIVLITPHVWAMNVNEETPPPPSKKEWLQLFVGKLSETSEQIYTLVWKLLKRRSVTVIVSLLFLYITGYDRRL